MFRLAATCFRFLALLILLSVAASLPILQWASLGYLLELSKRRSEGLPWRETFPGLATAGRMGWTAVAVLVCGLPAYFLAQFAYQAELVEPGSVIAARWRTASMIVGGLLILHVGWALMRGGRWRDFIWPAPIRFLKEIFRPSTWRKAEDALWEAVTSLHLPRLLWLGFRAWLGALAWLAIPAAAIIVGLQSDGPGLRGLVGVVGVFSMWLVLLYLPFLQTKMATTNRLRSMFRLGDIREAFQRAPWAFFFGSLLTLGLATPLYVFRIEKLPPELVWLPCLVFILLGIPARIMLGWAWYRGTRNIGRRAWYSRWTAWILQVAITPIYILFLYLGSLASWDGPLIVFLQHAFLTPVPFAG
jgi:hypothetical protein